jgi:MFS transporter, DHA1 family, inner membrane transport protein
MADNHTTSNDGYRRVAAVLFMSMFAAQAGAIALSPVLAEVANDLGVATATAGQLRTVAGLVAGVTGLVLGRLSSRVGLGRQLLGGSALLAVGSLGSAAAPGIALLFAAQVPVGAGIAVLTTAATLAAAEWVPPERRTTVLSWALIGQPSAWIIGMPLIGAVAGSNWRYAWIALPLLAAVVAGAAVVGRASEPPSATRRAPLRAVFAAPGLTSWLAGEMFANTAWAGTLVYSGALFVESYGSSTESTGVVLAIGAGAYVVGALWLRRFADRQPKVLLAGLAVVLALTTGLFGMVRPSVVISTIIFSAAATAAGGRTVVSSAFGLALPPELRRAAVAMRAASMQFGYFAGSFAAGTALGIGGYRALGSLIGLLFLGAGLSLVARSRRSQPLTGRLPSSLPEVNHFEPDGVASNPPGTTCGLPPDPRPVVAVADGAC